MKDIVGAAISDYYHNGSAATLWVHNHYGKKEKMPVEIFFRAPEFMPAIEILALQECKGKLLDIGAGAGSHTLLLQHQGFDVTALEISKLACAVMKKRGIRQIINADILGFKSRRFNTLLLLMNGIGICGTLDGLKSFLLDSKKLLLKKGRIIFDSSDISYLFDQPNSSQKYYGELEFCYEYKKQIGEWFRWLYIDQDRLKRISEETGYKCSILYTDSTDHYLASLTLK